MHLSVSMFNASEGEVITDKVSVLNDSNIASLKKSLGYENLEEIAVYHIATLLHDEDIIQECLEDGDELNAVVADQDESFAANTINYSSKKIIIRSERNKFLNLEVGEKKALRVECSFLWGTFAVFREVDALKDNETVYQGFKYNLPKDAEIQEIQISDKNVMKIMKKGKSPVVIPPLGKPIEMKAEEFSKGKEKIFLVNNEGPEIYLLTGTKTSFNDYLLAPKSENSLKILESKRFKAVSGSKFHFGLCKKAVQTELGTEYTAFMYDANRVMNVKKILIRNSEEGEGPNVVLIDEEGDENIQTPQDLPQKIFKTSQIKKFDDWLKLVTDVVSSVVKSGAAVAGAVPT